MQQLIGSRTNYDSFTSEVVFLRRQPYRMFMAETHLEMFRIFNDARTRVQKFLQTRTVQGPVKKFFENYEKFLQYLEKKWFCDQYLRKS
jgi:hypothetical protein